MPSSKDPAAVWRKSTTSNSGGCVEVAYVGASVLIRDSKDPAGPVLSVSPEAWAAFVASRKVTQLSPHQE